MAPRCWRVCVCSHKLNPIQKIFQHPIWLHGQFCRSHSQDRAGSTHHHYTTHFSPPIWSGHRVDVRARRPLPNVTIIRFLKARRVCWVAQSFSWVHANVPELRNCWLSNLRVYRQYSCPCSNYRSRVAHQALHLYSHLDRDDKNPDSRICWSKWHFCPCHIGLYSWLREGWKN